MELFLLAAAWIVFRSSQPTARTQATSGARRAGYHSRPRKAGFDLKGRCALHLPKFSLYAGEFPLPHVFLTSRDKVLRLGNDAQPLFGLTRLPASYLEVLDAQRSLFSAELTLAQDRGNEYQSLVQLYKALGGGWQQ